MVDLETLQTIVTEIKFFFNDPPLTFVPSSFAEPETLTKKHLWYGRKMRSLPGLGAETELKILSSVERNIISKRVRNKFRIIEQFLTRWTT
jgi:hypothetical protein